MVALLGAFGQSIALEDTSGIDGPSNAPEGVTPILSPLPPPGVYEYRVGKNTIDPDDQRVGESPPSPPTYINVPLGYYARVRQPYENVNWAVNGNFAARLPDSASTPAEWVMYPATGTFKNFDTLGVCQITDFSGLSTGELSLGTPLLAIPSRPQGTIRIVVDMSDYVSGALDIYMRELDINGNIVAGEPIWTLTGDGHYDLELVTGPDAGPDIGYVWNYSLYYTSLIFYHRDDGAGPRHFKFKVSNHGMIGGKCHPRKRKTPSITPQSQFPPDAPAWYSASALPTTVSPSIEPPELPYPAFGYTTIVQEPPDYERAVWVDGEEDFIPGNMMEYYGPPGTPVTSTFPMSNHRIAVKPGERRTVSTHFWYAGVGSPATPLKAVLKDTAGVTIADLGPFEGMGSVQGFSRNQTDADIHGYVRRKKTVIVPEDTTAAYIELLSGGVGDGLLRVMGFQNERGEEMTPFSITHAPTGALVSTFDLGVPGVPRDSLPTLGGVRRLVKMGASVVHDPDGETSHIVVAQSKNYDDPVWPDDWIEDIAELDIKDEVRVQTVLFTSNLDKTPEFHEHFLDFERELPAGRGFGSLCRGDGTEFDGTAVLYDFPPIREQEPITEEEYADHTHGFGVMGLSTDWARGFGVEFYLNSAAEEFMSLQGKGSEAGFSTDDDASVFVGEIFGKRQALRILDAELQPVDREGHIPLEGIEDDGFWLLQAEGIEAEVMGETDF